MLKLKNDFDLSEFRAFLRVYWFDFFIVCFLLCAGEYGLLEELKLSATYNVTNLEALYPIPSLISGIIGIWYLGYLKKREDKRAKGNVGYGIIRPLAL